MIIYHFCCKHDAKKIMQKGISLGCIPMHDEEKHRFIVRKGFQWLTLNGDPKAQSWATSILIRKNRTEIRFTIDIPDRELDSLLDMHQLQKAVPEIDPSLYEQWSGSEDWRVFRGFIPRKWIIECDEMAR